MPIKDARELAALWGPDPVHPAASSYQVIVDGIVQDLASSDRGTLSCPNPPPAQPANLGLTSVWRGTPGSEAALRHCRAETRIPFVAVLTAEAPQTGAGLDGTADTSPLTVVMAPLAVVMARAGTPTAATNMPRDPSSGRGADAPTITEMKT
jgi:hypothetical protein